MKRKSFRAVLFGPQGCGKSTQGQLLADRYGIPFIGAGDLLRAEMGEGSVLGKMVAEYVTNGMLAPDELADAILKKRLKEFDLGKGFLLDGYPRNVEQAGTLDRLSKINLAIQIKLKDDVAVKRLIGRLQCQSCRSVFHESSLPAEARKLCTVCKGLLVRRCDDTEDIIRKRLAAYHFMTEPLARYYRQKGVLLAVNGEQTIEQLFDELTRKLAKLGFIPQV